MSKAFIFVSDVKRRLYPASERSFNILLLPLYKKADELQHKEKTVQAKMKTDIDFIKKPSQ